jgi:hypothetical protein
VFIDYFFGSWLVWLTLHTPPEAFRLGHILSFDVQIYC